jgi:hypothetical protein
VHSFQGFHHMSPWSLTTWCRPLRLRGWVGVISEKKEDG